MVGTGRVDFRGIFGGGALLLAIAALPITISTPLRTPLPVLYPNLSSLGGLEKKMTVVCAVNSYGGNRCGGDVLFFFASVEQMVC